MTLGRFPGLGLFMSDATAIDMKRSLTDWAKHGRRLTKAFGPWAGINVLGREILGLSKPQTLRVGNCSVLVRPNDSDPWVAAKIFGTREYDVGDQLRRRLNNLASGWRKDGHVPVIIDGGANVGYSSIFFARIYPDAAVLAIEPDQQAFDLAQKNCAAFNRIIPMHTAIWCHDKGVTIRNCHAASWARSVSDGGSSSSRTLEAILASIPNARPLVLKLDIESAEREVCAASPEIVRAFPCILIEPHDFIRPGAGCLSPLYSAIAGKKMDTILRGENIILFDLSILN